MLRLVLAFTTSGVPFDIGSYELAARAFWDHGLGLYRELAAGAEDTGLLRWPYPPGFIVWAIVALALRRLTNAPFAGLIKLPMIFADLGIAVTVVMLLRARGVDERTQLLAAALIAFGPSFFLISGVHGQLDAVAILPALIALAVWERGGNRRAPLAGVLVGLGIALKTVPILTLIAILPTVRSRREGVTLLGAAALIPAATLAPFFLAEPEATVQSLMYAGAPGVGGLSLVVQPSLAEVWILGHPYEPSRVTETLASWAPLGLGIVLLAVAGLLIRRRVPAAQGVALVWLSVYAFSPNFFFQYLVWGLPFFLAVGAIRAVAAVQAVALGPTLLALFRPWSEPGLLHVYVPAMIVIWLAFAAAFVMNARRAYARGYRSGPGASAVQAFRS